MHSMNVDSAISYHNGYINLIENIKSDSVKINSFSHILVVILSFVKKRSCNDDVISTGL